MTRLPYTAIFLIITLIIESALAFSPLIHNSFIHNKFYTKPKKHIIRYTSSKDSTNIEKDTPSFPVLQKIKRIDWVGNCRYVSGSDLKQANFLLRGGTRYDIDNDEISLTSFLTFPNGKTRQVVMKGRSNPNRTSIRLDPTSDEGPIYMVLSELAPDTVLIHEVEKVSGRIVMTSSLSLVGKKVVDEIVMVSHELGAEIPVEGHQVWRLTRASWDNNSNGNNNPMDRGFRDTTGV